MTAVLIQPSGGSAAQDHYETSIRNKVRFSDHLDVLLDIEIASLNANFVSGEAAMWGLVPGDSGINISRWDSVSADDLVLFSGKKKMFAMGKVVSKFRNAQLAERLWGRDPKGQTWEYMYTLKDVHEIDIPYADFNSAVGDSPKNNHMGFRILDDEKSARFVQFLDGNGGQFRNVVSSIRELVSEDITEVLDDWGDQAQNEFLRVHELNRAQKYEIVYNGNQYDAKAVVDLAIRKRFPELENAPYDGNERTIARPLRALGFIVDDKDDTASRYWWVNQNQTREEIENGFMWSPKTRKDGAFNQFYENMTRVRPGDIVFSYYDSKIQSSGVIKEFPSTAVKPLFRQKETWAGEGWFVEVEYDKFANPISPKSHLDEIVPLLPKKYSPIRETGDGLQGVYLAEISEQLAEKIYEVAGRVRTDEKPRAAIARQKKKQSLFAKRIEREINEDKIEREIEDSTHIGDTEKKGITTSRRGQGKFRRNVLRRGPRCRVTGVSEPHLIASHIKPWSASTNQERIDGNNGLMLAPHIDHLFNDGFISFEDNGALLISSALDAKVFAMWGLENTANVGPFTPEQSHYLAYHRNEIFQR